MFSESLVALLRFLALPQREKLKYLPIASSDIRYEPPDEGDNIQYASEAAFRAAFHLLNEERVDLEEEQLHSLRRDLLSVMTIMLRESDRGANDLWWLSKEQHGISSHLDDLWFVVQRLALLTLQSLGLEAAPPQIPFEYLIRSAGFRRIRIERHVE